MRAALRQILLAAALLCMGPMARGADNVDGDRGTDVPKNPEADQPPMAKPTPAVNPTWKPLPAPQVRGLNAEALYKSGMQAWSLDPVDGLARLYVASSLGSSDARIALEDIEKKADVAMRLDAMTQARQILAGKSVSDSASGRDGEWRLFERSGIRIEVPLELTETTEQSANPGVLSSYEKFDGLSADESERFVVKLERMVFEPDYPLDLVETTNVMAKSFIGDMKGFKFSPYEIADRSSAGREIKAVKTVAMRSGENITMDIVLIRKGKTVACLALCYDGASPADVKNARRMVDSFKLEP